MAANVAHCDSLLSYDQAYINMTSHFVAFILIFPFQINEDIIFEYSPLLQSLSSADLYLHLSWLDKLRALLPIQQMKDHRIGMIHACSRPKFA